MTDDLLPLLSNDAPTGEALLDEFLATATVAQIAKLMETIGAKLAEDDLGRYATRQQLLDWTELWQKGGLHDGIVHAARPVIIDEAMAGKATALASKLKAAIKAEEDAREPAKKPLFGAGKAVDAAFSGRKKSLQPALDWINGLIDAWQKSERERLKRESEAAAAEAAKREEELRQAAIAGAAQDPEAQRKAEEAAAVAARAATAASAKIQIRSATGALATSRTEKHYRVTDWRQVPVEFLLFDAAKVRAAFRAGLPVAGIEEYEEEKTDIR
jgi:hypothetical protein